MNGAAADGLSRFQSEAQVLARARWNGLYVTPRTSAAVEDVEFVVSVFDFTGIRTSYRDQTRRCDDVGIRLCRWIGHNDAERVGFHGLNCTLQARAVPEDNEVGVSVGEVSKVHPCGILAQHERTCEENGNRHFGSVESGSRAKHRRIPACSFTSCRRGPWRAGPRSSPRGGSCRRSRCFWFWRRCSR